MKKVIFFIMTILSFTAVANENIVDSTKLNCKTIEKNVDSRKGRDMTQVLGRNNFLVEMNYGDIYISVSSLYRDSEGNGKGNDIQIRYINKQDNSSYVELASITGSIEKIFKTTISTPEGMITTACFKR